MNPPRIVLAAVAAATTACSPAVTAPPSAGDSHGGGHPRHHAAISTALVITRPAPRASRSARRTPMPRLRQSPPAPGSRHGSTPRGFAAWAASRTTYLVFRCESHWNPRAVNPSGKYRGLIQADAAFWASYGGLAYAPRPDAASRSEQLAVAYRGWLARGWSPWTCARLVGAA